jgi:hypothetical protein
VILLLHYVCVLKLRELFHRSMASLAYYSTVSRMQLTWNIPPNMLKSVTTTF